MTFYVCKRCNYKHTFLPFACAKCKGTNFYPLITSTTVLNDNFEVTKYDNDIEYRNLIDENKQLKAQIEKMKCCGNCQHEIADEDEEEYKTYCDNCENHCKWELKKTLRS